MDTRDTAGLPAVLATATERMNGLDCALLAHGTLADQNACQPSIDLTYEAFEINALRIMALCTLLANQFEAQGHGTLGVISSVAGERGRQSNYVYGSAKAAVTAFTSGLRRRLYPKDIAVGTIKP